MLRKQYFCARLDSQLVSIDWLINQTDTKVKQTTMTEIKFHVGMTCGGCAAAVKRILNKLDGVQSVDANVATKTVVVRADDSASPDLMLEKLLQVSLAAYCGLSEQLCPWTTRLTRV